MKSTTLTAIRRASDKKYKQKERETLYSGVRELNYNKIFVVNDLFEGANIVLSILHTFL